MSIKEIKSYECTDGQIFKDQSIALRHDATLRLEYWAEQAGICAGGPWSADMVTNTMIDNADELLMILSDISGNNKVVAR